MCRLIVIKVEKHSSRNLGISLEYLNMMKNGRRRVSDEVLKRLLEGLTAKALLELMVTANV